MARKLALLLEIMAVIAFAGAIIINIVKPKDIGVNSQNQQLKIVASFYPVYLIGLNLADQIENMEVKSLTKLNTGCLHDYQLTTQDMKNISEADVLIINGAGMEGFLDDVKENYPELTIIDASKGITLLGDNPHIWLDPQLYIRQIENVRDGLINYINSASQINGHSSEIVQNIRQNSDSYISKVSELDAGLEGYIDTLTGKAGHLINLPEAVIFHDSFAYLARRAGIDIAFSVPLDSDTSLSAGEIADIINEIKAVNIGYLFTEKQYSDSIAKQIEEETNAKAYVIDSVVTGDGEKDSYLNSMENNIEVLKEALKQGNSD